VAATSGFGARLARFDVGWTRLESVLCTAVLALEVCAFTFWIALKGFSLTSGATNHAGLVFRAAFGALALGPIANLLSRGRPAKVRLPVALGAALVGMLLGYASGNVGSAYFSNALNWLQDSSFLTLLGGLRGVGTELTWLLAMLGASLATGSSKHINIDALLRFLRPKLRVPAVVIGWIFAAVVCLAGVVGFFDHIAIESFGAPADATPGEKISIAWHEQGRHLFLLRKQVSLDMKTASHVFAGERYDSWLHGGDWNMWVKDGDWDEYFTPQQVDAIILPEAAATELHPPLVIVPSGGNSRGLLTRDLHLIFPFGLFIIGIRFLVRALLLAIGRIDLEAEAQAILPKEEAEVLSSEGEG